MRPSLRKLRIYWRWFWTNGPDAAAYERRRRFHRLTGLHPTYAHGAAVPDDEVIALQARKIEGLTLSLNQQRKGYQRKVARLEQRIADLARLTTQGEK